MYTAAKSSSPWPALLPNTCTVLSIRRTIPQEFAHVYDRLLDLSYTSPLVAHDDELRLPAMQHLILDLLEAADEDLRSALLAVLVPRMSSRLP